MAAPLTGATTIRNGLLLGALLGLLAVGNAAARWLTGGYHAIVDSTPYGIGFITVATDLDLDRLFWLGGVEFLAMLALTAVAGILTARGTGKVGAGALAGLSAGALGALVGTAADIVVALHSPGVQPPAGSPLSPTQAQVLFIQTALIDGASVGLLLYGGLGAGMGALGGLLGADGYRRAHPGMSYPPYPPPVYRGYRGLSGLSEHARPAEHRAAAVAVVSQPA
jgi:hypothetical protein